MTSEVDSLHYWDTTSGTCVEDEEAMCKLDKSMFWDGKACIKAKKTVVAGM